MSDELVIDQEQLELSGESPVTPQFKTVILNGRRKGLRLEKIYWKLLDAIAKRHEIKRSTLIAEILNADDVGNGNATSMLRCYIAEKLEQERDSLVQKLETFNAVNLLQSAPIPAFAINRQKRLLQVNPEFMQMLRLLSGKMSGVHSADSSQLTLETPVEQLFAELNTTSDWTQCNYSVRSEGRQKRGRAKIVPAPPFPASILVGYVLN